MGQPQAIEAELAEAETRGIVFSLVEAPQVIGMEERPAQAVRRKEGASKRACNSSRSFRYSSAKRGWQFSILTSPTVTFKAKAKQEGSPQAFQLVPGKSL